MNRVNYIQKSDSDNYIKIQAGSDKKAGVNLFKHNNNFGFTTDYDSSTDKFNIAQ